MPERKQILSEGRDIASKIPSSSRVTEPVTNDREESTSLLSEYGMGAGLLALGGLITKAKFAPRLAGKGLLNLGLHGLRRTGSKLGHSLVGGLAGAAVITPTAYLSAKAAENAENDKKFNAVNFASIAAPAAVSGAMGYGAFSNISQSIAGANKSGYGGMLKNIVSPKRNIRYSKHGLKLAGRAFKKGGKGRVGGMLALGFMGLEALSPGMYLSKTLGNKKENNNGRI